MTKIKEILEGLLIGTHDTEQAACAIEKVHDEEMVLFIQWAACNYVPHTRNGIAFKNVTHWTETYQKKEPTYTTAQLLQLYKNK